MDIRHDIRLIQRRIRSHRRGMITVWLLFSLLLATLIVSNNYREHRAEFLEHAYRLYDDISNLVQKNEALLFSFATMASLRGMAGRDENALFARALLRQNPQVHSLELQQRINNSERHQFVALQRATLYPAFTLKTFTYGNERRWSAVPDKGIYYPIVFAEPAQTGRDIIGLDVDSVGFLRTALNQAIASNQPVASGPFTLVQGDRGYVLFLPTDPMTGAGANLVASMVVRADALLPRLDEEQQKYSIRLIHGGSAAQPGEVIFAYGQEAGLSGAAHTYTRQLDSRSQPFLLEVGKQFDWRDVNPIPVVVWMLAVTVTFLLMQHIAWNNHRHELLRYRTTRQLYRRASHDSLTGLPNRTLLMDRLEHALSRARREQKALTLMFVDLDGFKAVNDTYGHDSGDRALRQVGNRLKACLRECDTVARLGGDEFVILLEDHPTPATLTQLQDKLQSCLTPPFLIEGREINLGASIGVARYPEDGADLESLLKAADDDMYLIKQSRQGAAPAAGK